MNAEESEAIIDQAIVDIFSDTAEVAPPFVPFEVEAASPGTSSSGGSIERIAPPQPHLRFHRVPPPTGL